MTHLPDFTPVPTASTRSDGWTPARQQAFIVALSELGGVGAAARAVGMTPQSANRLRRRPHAEGFAAAWDFALGEGLVRARDEAIRRGLHGRRTPIVHDGHIVGHRRRYDNRLLFAACYGRPLQFFDRAPAGGRRDPGERFEAALANLSRKLSEPRNFRNLRDADPERSAPLGSTPATR